MAKRHMGEGDYEASQKFQSEQHGFARSGKVPAKAREAANAIDGPEGRGLEKARKSAAVGKTG